MTSNKLESLRRGNKAKPFQSQLVPHLEFIREQRAERIPYAQIASALEAKFGTRISPSSIHSFVKVRSRKNDVYTIVPAPSLTPTRSGVAVSTDDAIARMKSKNAPQSPHKNGAWSFYDPSKPLEKLSHTT
jgi:hypothetical protein